MRTETRSEERVVTNKYTVYIAEDGTEFDNQKACEKHEIYSAIDKVSEEVEPLEMDFCATPLNYDGYADEEYCRWFKVNDDEDYQKLLNYYRTRTENEVVIDKPLSYPSVICVSEDGWYSDPYESENAFGYTLDDMKNVAKEFFGHFGIEVSFKKTTEKGGDL